MAFRDHLAAATIVKGEISLIHEMLEHSQSTNHAMTVFENITECPGHKSAVNMLTRDRLCAAIGIEPEAYIDTLGWAMTNPSSPVIVDRERAPCMENVASEVDLNSIPIPHHWPADRGRYHLQASSLPRTMAFEMSRFTDNSYAIKITWWFASSLAIFAPW